MINLIISRLLSGLNEFKENEVPLISRNKWASIPRQLKSDCFRVSRSRPGPERRSETM